MPALWNKRCSANDTDQLLEASAGDHSQFSILVPAWFRLTENHLALIQEFEGYLIHLMHLFSPKLIPDLLRAGYLAILSVPSNELEQQCRESF